MSTKKIITQATDNLLQRFQGIAVEQLTVSEYNKKYLSNYLNNYHFFMSYYSQLMMKALKCLKKPVDESTFVDYGGGCGMLSFLAKEIGFKTVVYNDLYDMSVADTRIISKGLNLQIDNYICGDVDQFTKEISRQNIEPDLICSFDVLEHIYDLDDWLKNISGIKNEFSLLFMTSANARNPFVSRRLRKLQVQAELKGLEKNDGWKERDLSTSFLEERKMIIRSKNSKLKDDEINLLATKTRGLRVNDIEIAIAEYEKMGAISHSMYHPTNTCDPYTGNWTEKLYTPKELKILGNKYGLKIEISNSYYAYSAKTILNAPKYVLNVLIKLLGKRFIAFSPTYTLELCNVAEYEEDMV